MAKKYLNEEGVKTVFELLKGNNNTGSNIEIVQETGESTTAVMSQKAVTDALKEMNVGGGENVNADWDAEEGEDGFIKNKPVIDLETEKLEELFNQTMTFSISSNMYRIAPNSTYFELKEGDKYKVIIDNKIFDNIICKKIDSDYVITDGDILHYMPSDGTFTIYQSTLNPNIAYKTDSDLTTVVKVYHYIIGKVKQFDPEYLPIVQETGDSETSIMSQKAVTDALKNFQGSEDSVSNVPEINQIVYSTIDGKKLNMNETYVETNIYYPNKGFGVITFKEDLTEPFFSNFNFGNNSDVAKLKSVVLPEGINILPQSFFLNCVNLESVELPSTITKFEYYNHFYQCNKLSSINLPNIPELPDYCFFRCFSLNHITLPNSVTKIGKSSFEYSGISNIDLNNVTEIGSYAFSRTQLVSLDTKKVTTIGEYAFYYCDDLNNVLFNTSLTELGNNCFSNCRSLNNINFIQNSLLQTIPNYCFSYCTSLNEISIDNNISSIGLNAFYYCPLRSITIHSSTIQSYNNAFNMDGGRPTLEYFYTRSIAPLQSMNSYYTIKTIVLDTSSFIELSTSSLAGLRNFATIYVNANLLEQYRTTYADYAQLFKPITGKEVGTMYWVGTKEEYELIEDKNMDTIYYILEDEENV